MCIWNTMPRRQQGTEIVFWKGIMILIVCIEFHYVSYDSKIIAKSGTGTRQTGRINMPQAFYLEVWQAKLDKNWIFSNITNSFSNINNWITKFSNSFIKYYKFDLLIWLNQISFSSISNWISNITIYELVILLNY